MPLYINSNIDAKAYVPKIEGDYHKVNVSSKPGNIEIVIKVMDKQGFKLKEQIISKWITHGRKTRSGGFIATWFELEFIKKEGIIDVHNDWLKVNNNNLILIGSGKSKIIGGEARHKRELEMFKVLHPKAHILELRKKHET